MEPIKFPFKNDGRYGVVQIRLDAECSTMKNELSDNGYNLAAICRNAIRAQYAKMKEEEADDK